MESWILVNIGSGNGLSPDCRQAISLTKADLLSIEPLWIKQRQWNKIYTVNFIQENQFENCCLPKFKVGFYLGHDLEPLWCNECIMVLGGNFVGQQLDLTRDITWFERQLKEWQNNVPCHMHHVHVLDSRNNFAKTATGTGTAFQSMGEQKSQMDMDEATNIIKTVTGESNTSLLTKCTRLGKAEKDKDRPLLLSFRETSHKENFMDNLKNLKGTQYQRISVVHDLTKKQREKLQELRNEAREKQSQDSGDWIYRVVGHPSMWTVKKMKRRTQHQAPNPESIPTTEEVTAESVKGKDPPPVGTARSWPGRVGKLYIPL